MLKNGRHHRTHLDWRYAKKVWGSHTSSRDQFAAGWLLNGGKLDNAAQSTKTRLLALARRNIIGGGRAFAKASVTPDGGTNCRGTTKTVQVNSSTTDYYYDSCDTSDIIDNYSHCAQNTGELGILTSPLVFTGAIAFIIVTTCGELGGWVNREAKKSQYSAIVWRTTRYRTSDGTYGSDLELRPQ